MCAQDMNSAMLVSQSGILQDKTRKTHQKFPLRLLRNDLKHTFNSELKSCRSYIKLKDNLLETCSHFHDFEIIPQSICFSEYPLEIDREALDAYPDDVPTPANKALSPCSVLADGNCLPSCGSVYAYGTQQNTSELRLRILNELVFHEESYLDNAFLQRGLNQMDASINLPEIYAQYSELSCCLILSQV